MMMTEKMELGWSTPLERECGTAADWVRGLGQEEREEGIVTTVILTYEQHGLARATPLRPWHLRPSST